MEPKYYVILVIIFIIISCSSISSALYAFKNRMQEIFGSKNIENIT